MVDRDVQEALAYCYRVVMSLENLEGFLNGAFSKEDVGDILEEIDELQLRFHDIGSQIKRIEER